jgi:transposase
MKPVKPKIIELHENQLEELLQRAAGALNAEDYQLLKSVVESYAYLTDLVEDKHTTIQRLRKLLFGASSEKTRDVCEPQPHPADGAAPPAASGDGAVATATPDAAVPPAPPKGHGRHGAADYCGAEKIPVSHTALHAGDACPDCQQGTVYESSHPGVLVRIAGQAPLQARIYELQKLRCHLCGKVFTAEPPPGVGTAKYDATAGSMVALLKYGSGLPFHRLAGLQASLGLPLPAATQWDIVHELAGRIEPVYEELIRQAAQGEVLFNDDTTIKILELMGKRAAAQRLAAAAVADPSALESADTSQTERRGLFTSGIVSTNGGRRIALFFSGRQHAGENLADVLARRLADLGPPIQMCDALSRNLPLTRDGRFASKSDGVASRVKGLPADLRTVLAHCLAHGRRQFVDVAERFPAQCRHVLEQLAEVYRNDGLAREQKLAPEARLQFHQAHSGPVMERLQAWLTTQFKDRLVEPNSALGEAITYLLKHWEKLTLFLRQPGAPLDNNVCERALKTAILHRKNALFFKTCRGAHVGDVFMSLIHTCQLCGANPCDYLTELQNHAAELSASPARWMPWNFCEALPPATPPLSTVT